MSFDRRVTRKFYTHEWSIGRCTLHITTESVATSPDPDLAGRAWLEMILVSRPLSPCAENNNLIPALTGAWTEEILAAKALTSTASWLGITSLIDTYPCVPLNMRHAVLLTICSEAKDAMEKAIFLDHTVVWMSIYMDVQTEEIGGNLVKLECNHEFSIERVIQWVTQNHLCPICNPEVINFMF